MIKRLVWTNRRRLLGVAVVCVALIASLAMLQTSKVAEAAFLYPHAGLVGWWRFDEGSGTLAEDSSGYGNHGTIYGATGTAGNLSNALSFDGIDDYVSVPTDLSIHPDNFTVMGWVKLLSHDASWQGVIDLSRWTSRNWWLITSVAGNGRIEGGVQFSGGAQRLSFPVVDFGDWHHYGITKNGTSVKFYFDGSLIASRIGSGTYTKDTARPLALGSRSGGGSYSNAVIDDVRIYDRALPLAEIETLIQKGPEFSSRLQAIVPKGTTQFIATLSWQGTGSINVTIESPSETYTEDMVPVYQKTVYSSSSGDILNVKRLAVSVTALSNDENWYIILEFDDIEDYKIAVEVQT